MYQIVIFLEKNARILYTESETFYKGLPNVAINPDLSRVAGSPPHHWRLEGGKVVLHDQKERQKRDRSKEVIKNDHDAMRSLVIKMRAKIIARHTLVVITAALMGLLIPILVLLVVR